jgi:dTDP-4-dehydrorhamnose 3,5-epimerase
MVEENQKKMEFKKEEIEGIISIYPKLFGDERGYFLESYNQKRYSELIGTNLLFVQDNVSKSTKGVLRGLHFQLPPYDQGKLVFVMQGKALDVAVDIRKSSPTYGKHVKVLLNSNTKNQLWIPPGFAHGFCALEDETVFCYKCTNFYSPEHEQALLWNDPGLCIDWEIQNPTISEKDKLAMKFNSFLSPF